jgi:para-nitrobenzyl esterase
VDCLYLNVWTPATTGSRPVLVWIPGGSFVEGSGSQPWYDPSELCRRGDVVVVSLNYRLGAFGWLYLDELGGEALGAASNCGLRDQIAALEWVAANIAQFGGDPTNVTVFGQSAGAWSITALLALPQASRLIHKAVNLSGGELTSTAAEGTAVAKLVLDRLGAADDLERLWTLDAAALVEVTRQAWDELGMWPFRPVVDGRFLGPPLEAIRSGVSRHVQLVVGSTLDEMKLVSTVDAAAASLDDDGVIARLGLGPAGERIVTAYREARRKRGEAVDSPSLYWAIESDRLFGVPGIRVAEAQSRNQPRTYMYLTTWRSPDPRLGACHSVDSALFFGTLGIPGMDGFTGTDDAAHRLSERMQDALLSFARTGDPNHPALPEWPPYREDDRATMLFEAEPHVVRAPLGDERAAWLGVV